MPRLNKFNFMEEFKMNTNELNQVTETSENADNQVTETSENTNDQSPKEKTDTPSHCELLENYKLFQLEILDRLESIDDSISRGTSIDEEIEDLTEAVRAVVDKISESKDNTCVCSVCDSVSDDIKELDKDLYHGIDNLIDELHEDLSAIPSVGANIVEHIKDLYDLTENIDCISATIHEKFNELMDYYEKKDDEEEFIKLTMWETKVEIFVRHKDIVSLIPTSDQINGEPPKSYTYVDLKGGHDDFLRVLETPAQIFELIRKAKRSISEIYTETLAENGLSQDEMMVWLTYQETDLTYKYSYNTEQLIEMIPKVVRAKKEGFDFSLEGLMEKRKEYNDNLQKSKDDKNDTNTAENK